MDESDSKNENDVKAPLVTNEPYADPDSPFPNNGDIDTGQSHEEALKEEVVSSLRLALPISFSELLSFASYLITTAQVGHLGASALSSFTLARTVFHITGLSLVVGFASGQSTFSGQAFGAKQFRLVGVLLQRSFAISLLVALAAVSVWGLGGEALMLALRQDPSLVSGASHLLHLMSPALVIWSAQVSLHNYFTSQGVVTPLAIIAALGVMVTPLVNHMFIHVAGWGLNGAAVAYNVLALAETLAMVAAALWLHAGQEPGEHTWGGLDVRGALSGWGTYLKIAAPSCAMICLDWWCFEVVVLIAGLQKDAQVQLGAMGVMFATHALAFMLASGFGGAAATRVSHALGAGHARSALQATVVNAVLGLAGEVVVSAALVIWARPWSALYSSDTAVVDVVAGCMPWLALSVAADSLNTCLSGTLRGAGHQMIGFAVNLTCFWFFGIPCAAFLDLRQGLGARGVWIALAAASLLQALVLVVCTSWFDWHKLARRAQRLVRDAGGLGHGPLGELTQSEAMGPGHHGVYEPLIAAVNV